MIPRGPLIRADDVRACAADAASVGAAVLAVPVKPTIKEVDDDGRVVRTLDRARLWEAQTPQCVKVELLRKGFEFVATNNLAVTDDVSVVEALGEPVAITRGAYTNIKVRRERGRGLETTRTRPRPFLFFPPFLPFGQ